MNNSYNWPPVLYDRRQIDSGAGYVVAILAGVFWRKTTALRQKKNSAGAITENFF